MKFGFVILHYKTADDTIACLSSMRSFEYECEIIVVDNFSNNGSIEIVENFVAKSSNVHIIKNPVNLGFAEGNNVGYRYAKEQCGCDFIAILNNDILFETHDFIEIVLQAYERNQFYVAGPDIKSLVDGGHQNPMKIDDSSPLFIKKEIWRYRLLRILSVLGLYDFFSSLLKTKDVRKNADGVGSWRDLKEIQNVQLHGAFLIFSPLFVQKEGVAFRPGTFLYLEESILFLYCKQKKYKTLFCPQLRVLHKEDSSTNSLFESSKGKREFVFKNMIQSFKVLYRYQKGKN